MPKGSTRTFFAIMLRKMNWPRSSGYRPALLGVDMNSFFQQMNQAEQVDASGVCDVLHTLTQSILNRPSFFQTILEKQ